METQKRRVLDDRRGQILIYIYIQRKPPKDFEQGNGLMSCVTEEGKAYRNLEETAAESWGSEVRLGAEVADGSCWALIHLSSLICRASSD